LSSDHFHVEQELAARCFAMQENLFNQWMQVYWQTAVRMELLRAARGNDFYDWLGDSFRSDQVDVIGDMLQKMKGERGQKMLKHFQTTGEFLFQ